MGKFTQIYKTGNSKQKIKVCSKIWIGQKRLREMDLLKSLKNVCAKFSRRNEFCDYSRKSSKFRIPPGIERWTNNTKINLKGQLPNMFILTFHPIQEDDLGYKFVLKFARLGCLEFYLCRILLFVLLMGIFRAYFHFAHPYERDELRN